MEFNTNELEMIKVAIANQRKQTVEAMDAYAEAGDWAAYKTLVQLNQGLTELFKKLKQCKMDSGKRFFAKFKDIPTTEIAMFDTKEARDLWVAFKDEFSLAFGTTPENCTFGREAITESEAGDLFLHLDDNGDLKKFEDEEFNIKPDEHVKGLQWIAV